MIQFKRYPHVIDLLLHYTNDLNANSVERILTHGVQSSHDAYELSKFIWSMADQMAIDNKSSKVVLGRTDNSDMLPDVDYEVGLYLNELGYGDIWDKVADES